MLASLRSKEVYPPGLVLTVPLDGLALWGPAMTKLAYSLAGWTCTIGEFVAGFVAVVFLAFALRGDGGDVLVGLIAAAATYGFHRVNERQGW